MKSNDADRQSQRRTTQPSTVVQCLHCLAYAKPDEQFCPCCGVALPKRCTQCGKTLGHAIPIFCPHCGVDTD